MRPLFVKMKKKMKSNFNFSNRILYSLISLVIISIVAVGVYAVPGAIPNPGHSISQLQPCGNDGETLVMTSGGAWTCATGGGALGNSVQGSLALLRASGDLSPGIGPSLELQSPSSTVSLTTSVTAGPIFCTNSGAGGTPVCPTDNTPSGNADVPYLCSGASNDYALSFTDDVYISGSDRYYQSISCSAAGTSSYKLNVNDGILQFVNNLGIPKVLVTQDGMVEMRDGNFLMMRPVGNAWDMRLQAVGQRLDVLSGGLLSAPIATFVHGGNVGIGTTSPNAQLEVMGTTADTGTLRVGNSWGNIDINGGNGGRAYIDSNNWALSLRTRNIDRLVISSDGKIGVGGVTSPTADLEAAYLIKAPVICTQVPPGGTSSQAGELHWTRLGGPDTNEANVICSQVNYWVKATDTYTIFSGNKPNQYLTGVVINSDTGAVEQYANVVGNPVYIYDIYQCQGSGPACSPLSNDHNGPTALGKYDFAPVPIHPFTGIDYGVAIEAGAGATGAGGICANSPYFGDSSEGEYKPWYTCRKF